MVPIIVTVSTIKYAGPRFMIDYKSNLIVWNQRSKEYSGLFSLISGYAIYFFRNISYPHLIEISSAYNTFKSALIPLMRVQFDQLTPMKCHSPQQGIQITNKM